MEVCVQGEHAIHSPPLCEMFAWTIFSDIMRSETPLQIHGDSWPIPGLFAGGHLAKFDYSFLTFGLGFTGDSWWFIFMEKRT
jgi:hypothetical protein